MMFFTTRRLCRAMYFAPLAIVCCIMFAACNSSDDTPPPPHNRWVYVAVSEKDSTGGIPPGLYRILATNGTEEIVTQSSVNFISEIAENGVLMLVLDNAPTTKLRGRCEDGSLISVPFPVSTDPNIEYEYAIPPLPAVSFDGHTGVYGLRKHPTGSTQPQDVEPALALVDCKTGSVRVVEGIDSVVINVFQTQGATHALLAEGYIQVNDAAGRIWFVAAGLRYQGATPEYLGWVLLEYSSNTMKALAYTSATPFSLFGRDARNNRLILKEDSRLLYYSFSSSSASPAPFTPSDITTPYQVSSHLGEAVVWDEHELDIRGLATGDSIASPLSIGTFVATYPQYVQAVSNVHLAFSPDGEWIAFLMKPHGAGAFPDLFVVKRNGEGLKRIKVGVVPSMVAVSNQVKN